MKRTRFDRTKSRQKKSRTKGGTDWSDANKPVLAGVPKSNAATVPSDAKEIMIVLTILWLTSEGDTIGRKKTIATFQLASLVIDQWSMQSGQ